MAVKKIVQDIVPTQRKSIRAIPIEKRISREDDDYNDSEKVTNSLKKSPEKIKINKLNEVTKNLITKKPKKNGKASKFLIFLIILVCITLISIALSFLYSKAIIAITPEKLDLNVNGNFIAKKDTGIAIDSLTYQVITLTSEANKLIEAIEGPLVQTKAKGTVTIYNSHSTTSQKIVAGTRISNNSGLVYRTLTSIVVPGKKTVQGKIVPGSINVVVIADKEGEQYNLKLSEVKSDFKLPGYKGTDKYDGFYAKLKTDISGGFSGKKKTISAELEKTTVDELNKTVKNKLLTEIGSSIPKDYVMFDESYTIEYQKISSSTNSKNMTNVVVKGTLYAIIFDSESFVNFIAKKQIADSRLVNYKVDGLKDLNFSIINNKDFSPKNGNTLSFSLKGPIRITGLIFEEDLKKKLVGLKVKEIDSVIKNNPSVKYATVLLTPFWMRSFPNSPENITIEYK